MHTIKYFWVHNDINKQTNKKRKKEDLPYSGIQINKHRRNATNRIWPLGKHHKNNFCSQKVLIGSKVREQTHDENYISTYVSSKYFPTRY